MKVLIALWFLMSSFAYSDEGKILYTFKECEDDQNCEEHLDTVHNVASDRVIIHTKTHFWDEEENAGRDYYKLQLFSTKTMRKIAETGFESENEHRFMGTKGDFAVMIHYKGNNCLGSCSESKDEVYLYNFNNLRPTLLGEYENPEELRFYQDKATKQIFVVQLDEYESKQLKVQIFDGLTFQEITSYTHAFPENESIDDYRFGLKYIHYKIDSYSDDDGVRNSTYYILETATGKLVKKLDLDSHDELGYFYVSENFLLKKIVKRSGFYFSFYSLEDESLTKPVLYRKYSDGERDDELEATLIDAEKKIVRLHSEDESVPWTYQVYDVASNAPLYTWSDGRKGLHYWDFSNNMLCFRDKINDVTQNYCEDYTTEQKLFDLPTGDEGTNGNFLLVPSLYLLTNTVNENNFEISLLDLKKQGKVVFKENNVYILNQHQITNKILGTKEICLEQDSEGYCQKKEAKIMVWDLVR